MTEANSSDQIKADIGPGATGINVGKNINQTIYQLGQPHPVDEATLAAAQARLAALPLDAIPAVSTLPPGSRMPLTPNPLFVGREAELRTLARTLKGGQTTAISPADMAAIDMSATNVAVATGGGGYGRTQLAVEFAHRYGQYFAGGVFWLNFANAAGVPAEIADCGGARYLDLRPDYATLKLDDQVGLVLKHWQDGRPRLLIFDNCEEETSLETWRPASGKCHILVTSRRHEWEPHLGVQLLPLAVLPRTESIALLRKFIPPPPNLPLGGGGTDAGEKALDAIAAELGDLPLALHLAGSYLKYYQQSTTPATFLAQLRSPALLQHAALQAGRHAKHSPTRHTLDVARTFALSYDRLNAADAVDGVALRLLARATCFAPNVPIPRALLLASLPHPTTPRGEVVAPLKEPSDPALQTEDALHRLVELGLLESEADGALRLHPLLARFVQAVSTDDDAQTEVEEIVRREANRLNNAGYPLALLVWQPHLRFITDQAMVRQDTRTAGLCSALDFHLSAIGDLHGARPYSEQALAINRAVLGEQHSDTATGLNNLGYLLQAQGDYGAARPYYEQALAIRRQVLGEQHPDTAQSLNNLGGLLRAQGDSAAARPYFEQALAIRRQVLGEQHPDTAQSLWWIGHMLLAEGEMLQARPYYEQALAIYTLRLGPNHPTTEVVRRALEQIKT